MKSFIAALVATAAAAGPTGYGYNNNQHNHSYGYQHGGHYPHAHQTSSSYDPWTGTNSATTSDKAKWFSPYQQYSSPKIKYTGGSSKETEFAQCYARSIQIKTQTSVGGIAAGATYTPADPTPKIQFLFQFAQAPGKTTTMKWYAATEAETGKAWQLVLTEYGRVLNVSSSASTPLDQAGQNGGATQECANMGNEWRPLGEKDKYGRVNPFQDPQRGRIQIITTTTTNTTDGIQPTDNIQANILINLSGSTSIMGRGIKVFAATDAVTPTDNIDDDLTAGIKTQTDRTTAGFQARACCVVGEDEPPTTSNHYHYGHGGYGYGGYSGSYGSHNNQEHSHDSGHGYGVGKHTHHGAGHSAYKVTGTDPVGYSGYQTPSHSHGSSVTHQHPTSAGSGTHNHYQRKPYSKGDQSDYFGGNSMFGGFKMPTPRYQSRRSSYRY